ncbi:glycosyltransferase [Variovorax sp. KK3]|uniref:glycosyltransferase family 2 protein n=1 Tax=Variovorax sp. KK3 TaxID=1855728 RepID=UPI00097C6B2D|nr:glycosyltransferase [Variovorax sp. KK3]
MKSLVHRFLVSPFALLRGPGLVGRIQRAWRIFGKSGWAGVRWELGRRIGGHNDYDKWVRQYDTLTPELHAKLAGRVAAMQSRPLISVVMPTYNPNPAWLREAIESVRAQIYPEWELCIADDASTSKEVRQVLESYRDSDPRIKVVFRPKNGHISASSNSAIELVGGPWIALMDHDDLLPAHALFCVADCIAAHPDVQLIYSDEDKVDEHGHRFGPYFKPDWNIDLFRSQNMFSHLGVLATGLVREVGGFRVGLEGSQDWDLVLRCMERLEPGQVQHIPRVLYHWRVHGESTAKSMAAKPYAALAGERALNEHFARTGVPASAEFQGFGYRARYALPEPPPLVTLIVVPRHASAQLTRCVDSLLGKTVYPHVELLVMDTGDPALRDAMATLAGKPGVRVLPEGRDAGQAKAINATVLQARGDLVAVVDSDLEVLAPDWLSEMAALALQPGVGAVGARLWYPNGTLQHAGLLLGGGERIVVRSHHGMPMGREGYGGRAALIQSFSAVSADCLVVRKAAFDQVGGFDEAHLQADLADVDFCLRLREAGYRNLWTPYAELAHQTATQGGRDMPPERRQGTEREMAHLRQRWADVIDNDPAYSPNLMLAREDFSYAWPPRLAPL